MKKVRRHFMGIGGQGISAVAQMSLQAGDIVTGCDRQPSATTRAMEKAGIPVFIGHSAGHLHDVDTLVISAAVPALDPQNPELLAARERGIQVIAWQELLGDLMKDKCVLSVSGVHGKGTTTTMLSLMLVDADLDPTCEIGAVVPQFGANYRLGEGVYFVNEADEFNHNFWHYHPRLAIVTSIEFEHPEFFADYDAFLNAFEQFIRGMDMERDWPLPPTLVVNASSPGCHDLLQRLQDWSGRVVTYAVKADMQKAADDTFMAVGSATFEAYDVQLAGETSFRVRSQLPSFSADDLVFHLRVPGLHNIENALASLTAAALVGVDARTIQASLERFAGTKRRFEIRHQGPLTVNGRSLDVMLVDDYAHHPTAIAMTLDAVRRRYPGKRVVAIYQPHMFSRTKTFFTQFLTAFDAADISIIADIFPARERDTGLISSRDLVDAMQKRLSELQEESRQVLYGGSVQDTAVLLRDLMCSGDVILIMGAGDIYTLTDMILQEM